MLASLSDLTLITPGLDRSLLSNYLHSILSHVGALIALACLQ